MSVEHPSANKESEVEHLLARSSASIIPQLKFNFSCIQHQLISISFKNTVKLMKVERN